MEYTVTANNAQEFIDSLMDEIKDSGGCVIVKTQSANVGSWSMARLWRSWMASTALFMASNGVTMPLMIDRNGNTYGKRNFNAEDAHDLFTAKWLGEDENGNRLSWSRNGREGMRAATKGERLHALRQHEEWCSTKGIVLINPSDSEYRQLLEQENK